MNVDDGVDFGDDNMDDEYSDEAELTDDDDAGIVLDVDESSAELVAHVTVLPPDRLVEYMRAQILEVAGIVELKPTVCRLLLSHFKWDKESMLETYYDSGDARALFAKAQIAVPSSSRHVDMDDTTCMICFEHVKILRGMDCGHKFCAECWNDYLTQKVTGEGVGHHIECPMTACDILVDDELAVNMIDTATTRLTYQRLMTHSFVEHNNLMCWCPSPGCVNTIRVDHVPSTAVKCACGYSFCFRCSLEWHAPIDCAHLRAWSKKCSDDSETSNWINANTKDCPKCSSVIEKDGGCNHIQCKKCKHEFCWLCQGPWAPHGSSWYSCNRFDDTTAKNARDGQQKSRAALERYLHYFNRFVNHKRSLTFEIALYTKAKEKMDALQARHLSWVEVQFVQRSVDTLTQCRRTLMYTYAFAYFLQKNNQVEMFLENQRDLEVSTEKLSDYLEHDMAESDVAKLKQRMQDLCVYVGTRREEILKLCLEGYENDWWQMNTPL